MVGWSVSERGRFFLIADLLPPVFKRTTNRNVRIYIRNDILQFARVLWLIFSPGNIQITSKSARSTNKDNNGCRYGITLFLFLSF